MLRDLGPYEYAAMWQAMTRLRTGEDKLTHATIEDRIISYFLAVWGEETLVIQENEVPIWLSNETEAQKINEWARIVVRMTTNTQDSFGYVGNRRMQRTGRVYIQLFVKTGIKTARINELTTKAVGVFENIVFSRLRILEINESFLQSSTGDTIRAPSKTDGVWFGKLVNVLFQFDEIK